LYWLARRELVDVDGRLTTRADEIAHLLAAPALASAGTVNDGREGQTARLVDRDDHIAVAVYLRARDHAVHRQPWMPTLADVPDQLDLRPELGKLRARRRAEGFSLGTREWIVVAPLALVGLLLFLLPIVVGIMQALGFSV
jgi:hypothetical protein